MMIFSGRWSIRGAYEIQLGRFASHRARHKRYPIPDSSSASVLCDRTPLVIGFFSTCHILFPWAELDRAIPQNLRFRRTDLGCGFTVDAEDYEDRLVQLNSMRLQAGTWNSVTILAVTSTSDLVGVEVLGVRVVRKVLLSRRILVAGDASDTIPYVRAIDAEI